MPPPRRRGAISQGSSTRNCISLSFLGRSGSGKGTQAKHVARRLKLRIIGTGNILRHFIAHHRGSLSDTIRAELRRGKFMPSWLVFFMWLKALLSIPMDQGIIFDGSPRRLQEAKLLDEVLAWLGRSPLTVVVLDISRQEARRRLLRRARQDDTKRAIGARLRAFDRDVVPVVKRYAKKRRVIVINGELSPQIVTQRILDQLT